MILSRTFNFISGLHYVGDTKILVRESFSKILTHFHYLDSEDWFLPDSASIGMDKIRSLCKKSKGHTRPFHIYLDNSTREDWREFPSNIFRTYPNMNWKFIFILNFDPFSVNNTLKSHDFSANFLLKSQSDFISSYLFNHLKYGFIKEQDVSLWTTHHFPVTIGKFAVTIGKTIPFLVSSDQTIDFSQLPQLIRDKRIDDILLNTEIDDIF